jgi:hypothetical protein
MQLLRERRLSRAEPAVQPDDHPNALSSTRSLRQPTRLKRRKHPVDGEGAALWGFSPSLRAWRSTSGSETGP